MVRRKFVRLVSRPAAASLCLVALAAVAVIVAVAQSSSEAPAAFSTPVNNDQSGAVSNGMTDNSTFAADEAVFMEE